MLRSLEGNQRIVQALRLPIGLPGAPVAIVSRDSEEDVVMADVLRPLIVRAAARARSANEREADGVVVRLVGRVLAIGEDRCAVAAALVSEIDPLMRRDFKLARLLVRTLNRAHVPVVGRHLIRSAEWEGSLEIDFFCVPVNFVGELDAIAGIACGEPNGLHEVGAFSLTFDLQGYPSWTVFDDGHLWRAADVRLWRTLLVFKVHVPRRPVLGIICGDREANRSREQLFVELLIENAGDVAISIQLHDVTRVLE